MSKKKELVSSDTVSFGDWLIKVSQFNNTILLIMLNEYDGNFVMHFAEDIYKANLIIEYVIEKGGFYD